MRALLLLRASCFWRRVDCLLCVYCPCRCGAFSVAAAKKAGPLGSRVLSALGEKKLQVGPAAGLGGVDAIWRRECYVEQ